MEIIKYLQLNNSENTKYQNFWEAAQAIFRRKKDVNDLGV